MIKNYLIVLLAVLPLFYSDNVTAAELSKIQQKQGSTLELSGQFRPDCQPCEIIVDYGKGFLYAYKAQLWTAKKLSFKLQDLGKSLKVKVFVRTRTGDSNSMAYNIRPELSPPRLLNKIQSETARDKKHIFTKKHADAFGGKGIDEFKVSSNPPKCNASTDVFHQARIVIDNKRFGDARIEFKPKSACVNCQPIKVRWYHEPTGSIHYQLHIQQRQIQGLCPAQIRHK